YGQSCVDGPRRMGAETASLYQPPQTSSTFQIPPRAPQDGAMTDRIDTLLKERRSFPPPRSFREQALVRSGDIYKRASRNPQKFWAERAAELEWFKPWR